MVSAYFQADAITLIAKISMGQRSSYTKDSKAQIVQECLQPNASVSSIAINHGINANMIRKWLPIYCDKPVSLLPAFVALQPMPKRHADESMVIALPLADKSITIKWPAPTRTAAHASLQPLAMKRSGTI